MQFYSKLIAALVGLAVILGGRYGIDLTADQQLITDAIGSVITAIGVWRLTNKPTTEAQVEVARTIATAGAKEVRES